MADGGFSAQEFLKDFNDAFVLINRRDDSVLLRRELDLYAISLGIRNIDGIGDGGGRRCV